MVANCIAFAKTVSKLRNSHLKKIECNVIQTIKKNEKKSWFATHLPKWTWQRGHCIFLTLHFSRYPSGNRSTGSLAFANFGYWDFSRSLINTVEPCNKGQFDKEQIGIKEPFPVINLKNSEFCKLLRPTLKIKKKHTLGMLILSQKTF